MSDDYSFERGLRLANYARRYELTATPHYGYAVVWFEGIRIRFERKSDIRWIIERLK